MRESNVNLWHAPRYKKVTKCAKMDFGKAATSYRRYDVAGIGLEVVAVGRFEPRMQPYLVGDTGTMERALKQTYHSLSIVPIHKIEDARPAPDRIPVLQATQQNLSEVQPGRVDAAAGQAAFDFVCAAIDLTMRKKADGIVTMPLNKEVLHAAGLKYPGHTEILAEKTGVKEFGMMLFAPGGAAFENAVGVVHVTLHMALREVFQHPARRPCSKNQLA